MKPFGVRIDCDLHVALSYEDAQLFRQLYLDHSLVVAHNQKLSPEQQTTIMEYLGPVPRSRETIHTVSNNMQLGDLGAGEIRYHADLGGTSRPRIAGSLLALDVVNGATSTMFANTTRGYERLPHAMKDLIEGLYVINENSPTNDDSQIAIGRAINPNVPSARHPLVAMHPQTGKPILCLSHLDTVRIEGLSEKEMTIVAHEIFNTLYAPDNVVPHIWKKNDLVIWDNAALQHARGDCLSVGTRTLQRVVSCEKLFAAMQGDRYFIPVEAPVFKPYIREAGLGRT